MKRTVECLGYCRGGAWVLALLSLGLTACTSVQRDLRPMTDAEAIQRYEHDPRVAPQSLAERERAAQERHWFEENRRH